MIIEAAPRLRDGSLEGYSSSSGKPESNKTTSGSRLHEARRCYRKLEESGAGSVKTKLHDREKTRADLLDSDFAATHHPKNRRTSRRGHPYKGSKGNRRADALDSLLSAVFECKCQSLIRKCHREKTIEILGKVSQSCKPKIGNRGSKSHSTFTSPFTANANENNDNVYGTSRCDGGFALTNSKPTSSTQLCARDENFDAEIEDITAAASFRHPTFRENTYISRKTHNTNPLSSTAIELDHPDLLRFSDKFIGRDSRHTRRDVRTNDQERELLYLTNDSSFARYPRGKTLRELIQEDSREDTEPRTHFFETLAAFADSRPVAFAVPCSNANRSSAGHRSLPSSCPFRDTAHLRQRSLEEDWESVNKISLRHNTLPPTFSPAGVIYNNNGNAASAPRDSNSPWPGQSYSNDKLQYVDRHDIAPIRETSPLPSHVFFLGNNRNCVCSSLARSLPDTDLRDFGSTGVSRWSGARPGPISFDGRKQERPTPFDSLIDLQATSNRSASWVGRKDSRPAVQSAKHGSGFHTQFSKKHEKSAERFQSNPCQVRTKESKPVCLSANNHHNAPWFSSEERSFEEQILREKGFSFESFQLNPTLFEPFLRESSLFFNSSLSGEMGCIQSIAKAKVSPDRSHHSLIVDDIQAAIDRTPTVIEENSPIVLRYRTPYFRASAHVIVPPILRKETWTVGWIQACDSMKFINQYGSMGSSSWEIPALKDRRITAVSDSDGVSYPWYGNTTEIATVEGPTDASRSLTLRMNDNFYPSVTWDIPVSEGSEAHLTHIVRDQSFTTWLAAVNQTTGRLEVLRTVKWHFYLEIDVDPMQELGNRARIVSPLVQRQPIVLKTNSEPVYVSTSPHRTGNRQKRLNRRPGTGGDNNSNNHTNFIPKSALIRPSANNAQTLVWRPTRDVPVIVVPAKEEYRENNEVVWFTRTPTADGHDDNVRVLSMQEMSQLQKSIS